MKKTSSISRIIQLMLFIGFISAFFILQFALPDRSFSEQENRYLQEKPSFSFKALFSGSFTKTFERYVTDQFPFRDTWIGVKSESEEALGKTENNNVFICKDDTLITRLKDPDMKQVDQNIAAVQTLVKNTDAKVYFALIPTAAAVWDYKLPKNANTCNQKLLISYIYSKLGTDNVKTVDMYSALEAHKDEYIYYRTDHHWTTLGAYYGYNALAESIGLKPAALSDFTPTTVSKNFYGTVYSSSGVRNVKPDSIDTYVSDDGVTVTNYPKGIAIHGVVYDYAFLNKKDKYSVFFGGNTPRLVIETGHTGGKALVIRDSYADSEIPFLFNSYSEIHMLDLRYYKDSIAKYIKENGIDTVIVSYGLSNFATDTSVFLMSY